MRGAGGGWVCFGPPRRRMQQRRKGTRRERERRRWRAEPMRETRRERVMWTTAGGGCRTARLSCVRPLLLRLRERGGESNVFMF
ncbi:hypothetical protein VTK73DRAFT_4039 [Phialemonium thermophilum]|uniref:Uncharacterized protein n=1 Tax=Phialemonium thermophilum TaxID=223376 RepID=A0ABR3VCM9_9PEZI